MGQFRIKIEPKAKTEISKHFKSGNKATIRKIEKFLLELSIHPFSGEGKPEMLKFQLSGFWSRRINKEHRLVYRVEEIEEIVYVLSAWGHYEI